MGPVSPSSPEEGRRTHRAFDRAFIGLLHKDKRLSHTGQSLSTTGSAVIERHGLCRESAALHEVHQYIAGWRSARDVSLNQGSLVVPTGDA